MNKLHFTQREQSVYDLLCDDKSKRNFYARKLFAFHNDNHALHDVNEFHDEHFAIIDKLKKYKYALYGAGKVCEKLALVLIQNGAYENCVAIFDRNPDGKCLHGVQARLPDSSTAFDFILPAISEKFQPEAYNEVLRSIDVMGVSPERIINPYFILLETRDQYFDEDIIVPFLKDDEVFVDGGSYDFFTSRVFIEKCDDHGVRVKSIYAFEPDRALYSQCLRNSVWYEYANVFQYGLWSKESELDFSVTGMAGSLSVVNNRDLESVRLRVVALDDILPNEEQVTFIKLDIEGAEREALIGAKKTIERDKPKLAICVYHKPMDYLEIPEQILEYRADYKLFLRTYNCGGTVLYCT